MRFLFFLLFLAGAPLWAETDFFGNPITPRPATPKPATPAAVRPPGGAAPAATPPPPVSSLLRLATPAPAVKGMFYVSVEDSASIHVNGAKVHDAGYKVSHSGELELKVGDRVVVQLHVRGYGRKFEMLFATSDKEKIVSFRAADFKILPDPVLTDFTPAEYAKWSKPPKADRRRSEIPIKSYSDNLWGDADDCAIACIVTAKMFSQRPK